MSGEEVPTEPQFHEIVMAERSSFVGMDPTTKKDDRSKTQIDKMYKKALTKTAAQREPATGHEALITGNLTKPQRDAYLTKFRLAFPDASPGMIEDVKGVLKGEANSDADAELDVIVPIGKTKAPPRIKVNLGTSPEKWTEHTVPGLDYAHHTSRQMAIYTLAYFTFHHLIRDNCLTVKKGSHSRKPNCGCVSLFCNYLRDCLHTLGGKDNIVAVKLYKIAAIPILTELVESQRMIIDGKNDEVALSRYVYGKVFCWPKGTQNRTPHTIINIGGRDTPFCLSIPPPPMELFGRKHSQDAYRSSQTSGY